MNNRPNFLVVGPPKCASSSLYFYLNQHPEVFMSPVKETHFFSINYEKGISYYENYFLEATNEKAIGEATPTYSFLPFVPPLIKNHYPDMKFIFSFRNPVDRAYSGWLMRQRNGAEKLSFSEALKANAAQIEKGFSFNKMTAEVWSNSSIQLTFRTYIEAGKYSTHFEHYRNFFNEDQIKIVWFHELQNDTQNMFKSLCRFLNIDDSITINTEAKNQYRKSYLGKLYNIVGRKNVLTLSTLFPKKFRTSFRTNLLEKQAAKPNPTPEERNFAYQFFKEDIENLEKMLSIDLSDWKIKN